MLEILGEAALRSLVLAGVVRCALWLLRVRRAQLLLAAWTIVLAATISMPVLPQFIPVRFQLDWAPTRPMIDGATELLQSSAPPPGDAAIETGAPPSTVTWMETVYLVVGSIMLLRVALGVGLSWRLLARAIPVRTEWAAGWHVRISRDLKGPVTVSRTILLPIDAADWPADMRTAVLAHEQSHVARWDFAMLIVSQLNRALFWFNPLSWWLHARLVTLTELTSDDQAMALTRDRLGYAEILLQMGRRSGPVFRGPAMARPLTLPQRIDRILLDHASVPPVSRSQQATLVLGVTAVSLGAACLLPGVDPGSPVTRPSAHRDLRGEGTIGPTRQDFDQLATMAPGIAVEQGPPREEPAATLLPSSKEVEAEPRSPSAAALRSLASSAATQSSRAATPSPPRPTLQTVTRTAPVLSPSRLPARQAQVAVGQGGRVDVDGPAARSTTTRLPGEADVSDVSRDRSPTGHDGICTGTVTVGMRAGGNWPYSSPQKTTVVPGQKIAAQARFFHRADGTSWVRFDIFDRPPLDLPVRSVQGGLAWTGEYGIAYAVQAAGSGQLVGLAAPIASDSARLEFSCTGSGAHLP